MEAIQIDTIQDDLVVGLYDVKSNNLIETIEDGDRIQVNTENLYIGVFPQDSVLFEQTKSIFFTLNYYQAIGFDNTLPYALFGEFGADRKDGYILAGENEITLDLYSDERPSSEPLQTVTRKFTIIDESGEEQLSNNNSTADLWNTISNNSIETIEGEAQTQSSLATDPLITNDLVVGLYDTSNDTLIKTIEEGDRIVVDTTENLSIGVYVPEDSSLFGQAESMFFDLNDGMVTQTENVEPYALFGDRSGDFNGGSIPTGANEITLEVYSQNNLGGELLQEVTLDFTLVDNV